MPQTATIPANFPLKNETLSSKNANINRTTLNNLTKFGTRGFQDGETKDVYGFQSDEVSLRDAFEFADVTFKDAVPEQAFYSVCLQNRRLWILTQKQKLLVKHEIDWAGKSKNMAKPYVDDQFFLRRAKIKKMVVDDSGEHCLLLSDSQLFYNNWGSKVCSKIEVFPANQEKV